MPSWSNKCTSSMSMEISNPTRFRQQCMEIESCYVSVVADLSALSTLANDGIELNGYQFAFGGEHFRQLDRVSGFDKIWRTAGGDHWGPQKLPSQSAARASYLKMQDGKVRLLGFHADGGRELTLVAVSAANQRTIYPTQIAMWTALMADRAGLDIQLADGNIWQSVDVSLKQGECSAFEAEPGDVLGYSVHITCKPAKQNGLQLDGLLYRLLCNNGTVTNERHGTLLVDTHSHDLGAARERLERNAMTLLNDFSAAQANVQLLLEQQADSHNLLHEVVGWLKRRKTNSVYVKSIEALLTGTPALNRYDVFNAITASRHSIEGDSAKIEDDLARLGGKYLERFSSRVPAWLLSAEVEQ